MTETATTPTSVTTTTSLTKPASEIIKSQDAHLLTSAQHTNRGDPADGARHDLERDLQKQRQFTADLSHELRTPITGLRTELEEAQLHPDQTDLQDLFDRMLGDIDRLEAIITDALLLAKLEAGPSGQRQHVDLAELVRAEVTRRRDPITVRLRVEPDVTISATPTRIAQILTNLLDNAQRHAEQTVQLHLRRDDQAAELSVADDGEGVAKSDRERVFERFTRLNAARDRDHMGTGLGLAIARDIAHEHSGTLHVTDSALGGARLVLRLPLTPRPRSTEPVPAPGRAHSSAGSRPSACPRSTPRGSAPTNRSSVP